jgi:ACT domain-containing protein
MSAAEKDRVVLTVTGHDRVGIVYNVSKALAERQVNILDITQSILQGEFFVMAMVVDMAGATCSLEELQEELNRVGGELGVAIQAQHERIFQYMHRI